MHNLDRVMTIQETMNETAPDAHEYTDEFEYGHDLTGEFETGYAGEMEMDMEMEMEMEAGGYGYQAGYGAGDGEYGGQIDEVDLAAELLSVTNEAEMDQFIGRLLRTVGRGVRSFARSPVGRAIGGAVRQVARTALPVVGGALGSMIPIPGVGTALGTAAGKALSKALEMETAGLPPEDREFEVATRIVRLADQAARVAAQAPPGANPNAVASRAIRSATQAVLQPAGGAGRAGGRRQRGTWVRRGNTIVLMGV